MANLSMQQARDSTPGLLEDESPEPEPHHRDHASCVDLRENTADGDSCHRLVEALLWALSRRLLRAK